MASVEHRNSKLEQKYAPFTDSTDKKGGPRATTINIIIFGVSQLPRKHARNVKYQKVVRPLQAAYGIAPAVVSRIENSLSSPLRVGVNTYFLLILLYYTVYIFLFGRLE